MINQCKELLVQNAAEWRLPAGGEWSFLMHNNYHPHISNLNVMWFHGGGEFPRAVVKFCEDRTVLGEEFERLRRAYACMPDAIPRPLYLGPQGRLWGLWMEGVPGSTLTEGGDHSARLRALADLVTSMHEAFRLAGAGPDQHRYRKMVEDPLQALAQFGSSAAIKAGCAETEAAVSPKWLGALPVIPQHGDMYPGNILVHRDRFSVVDWEGFGKIDLPLCDLAILLFSLLRVRGAKPADWGSATARLLPSLIRAYVQRLNLNSSDVPLLFSLALANWFHAQMEEGRQTLEPSYDAIQSYFEDAENWNQVFRAV